MTKIERISAAAVAATGTPEKTAEEQRTALKKRRQEDEQVRAVAEQLNKLMDSTSTKLSFQVDRSLKKTIIKVVDAQTNQVIRQIPSEDALKMAQNVQQMMGILYDTSA